MTRTGNSLEACHATVVLTAIGSSPSILVWGVLAYAHQFGVKWRSTSIEAVTRSRQGGHTSHVNLSPNVQFSSDDCELALGFQICVAGHDEEIMFSLSH